MNQTDHHVAWKDRIGLSERWEEAIKGCYYNWGKPSFFNNLDALTHLIVNLKDGPALYNQLELKQVELRKIEEAHMAEWQDRFPSLIENPSYYRDELKRYKEQHTSKHFFHFIVQLLEDNGFGFYKARIDEVEQKMI